MKWLKSIAIAGRVNGERPPGNGSTADLETENRWLREQLRRVVETAAENEAIWRHFLEIERLLFRTREFRGLVNSLLSEVRSRFVPDLVVLYLAHGEIIERYFPELDPGGLELDEGAWICLRQPHFPAVLGERWSTPRCLDELECRKVLSGVCPHQNEEAVRSAVMIPISIHELVFGALLLGSRDADYYRPDDGTELLEQLGTKIALCMENCLAYERVKDLSDCDHITGLLNFFQIHTVLEREFRRAKRLDIDLAAMIVDLDFVEEAGGHLDLAGPVLRHVATLLRHCFPEGRGFIGRRASHEFMLVMPYASEEEAGSVARALSDLIRRTPLKQDNTVILVQPRIGLASLDSSMGRAHDLIDAAVNRLYRAKTDFKRPGPAQPLRR